MFGDYVCPKCGGRVCDHTMINDGYTMSTRSKRDGFGFEALPDPFEEPPKAENDPVNRPSHYTMGGIEVLDAVEAWGLDSDAYLFNAIKYIARAGKKDPAKYLEDLKKARFYLDRKIKNLEKAGK